MMRSYFAASATAASMSPPRIACTSIAERKSSGRGYSGDSTKPARGVADTVGDADAPALTGRDGSAIPPPPRRNVTPAPTSTTRPRAAPINDRRMVSPPAQSPQILEARCYAALAANRAFRSSRRPGPHVLEGSHRQPRRGPLRCCAGVDAGTLRRRAGWPTLCTRSCRGVQPWWLNRWAGMREA